MLSLQPHHHHHHHYHFPATRHPTAAVLRLCLTPSPPSTTTTADQVVLLRKHNAASTSILHNPPPVRQNATTRTTTLLDDLSVATTKNPQFPGSVTSSLPPVLENAGGVVDEEVLVRALEIRRKVTAEVFKEAMRKGKFGITYATNLAGCAGEFLDYVMVQAAGMKRLPEFSRESFNVRARRVLDESYVVPIIRWLKHNGLSYPQIGKLICMSRRDLESIRRLADWLKTIHVHGRFIGSTMLRSGKNIFERSVEELDEVVKYLESKGVRGDWIGYVVSRCPEVLCFTMEELIGRTNFYFDMGMNEKDFGTMLFDCPKVFGYFSLEEMNQKVAYIMEFGLSREEAGRLLAFRPQLMSCSIEERWKPLVKYLYYLGISRDGMRRILTVKPMVFCFDLESNIVAKVQFLKDIGVQDDAVGNALVKFPHLLTYSLYKKIRPVVIFLLTDAGVQQKDIGKVIALGPELLGCSISKKLDPNVKYFLSLGIKHQVLGEMIADFPMLLRYNIDVLCPKYQYLRRTMVRPLEDLIEFPRFFSYSLEERIIPRHKILMKNRINFKLRYMLGSTDEAFQRRVEAAVQRRQKFESGIVDDGASKLPPDDSLEEEIDHSDAEDHSSSAYVNVKQNSGTLEDELPRRSSDSN